MTSTSSSASDLRTSIDTNPGNPCTWPRLSENRFTISSAAPSLTGRELKIAITDTSEVLAGDHDAAAADAFGHLERPEGLSHEFPRARSVRRILDDSDVDFEVSPALRKPLEHTLRQPITTFTALVGQYGADLIVAEAGAY